MKNSIYSSTSSSSLAAAKGCWINFKGRYFRAATAYNAKMLVDVSEGQLNIIDPSVVTSKLVTYRESVMQWLEGSGSTSLYETLAHLNGDPLVKVTLSDRVKARPYGDLAGSAGLPSLGPADSVRARVEYVGRRPRVVFYLGDDDYKLTPTGLLGAAMIAAVTTPSVEVSALWLSRFITAIVAESSGLVSRISWEAGASLGIPDSKHWLHGQGPMAAIGVLGGFHIYDGISADSPAHETLTSLISRLDSEYRTDRSSFIGTLLPAIGDKINYFSKSRGNSFWCGFVGLPFSVFATSPLGRTDNIGVGEASEFFDLVKSPSFNQADHIMTVSQREGIDALLSV